jgi:hypothetical protein
VKLFNNETFVSEDHRTIVRQSCLSVADTFGMIGNFGPFRRYADSLEHVIAARIDILGFTMVMKSFL